MSTDYYRDLEEEEGLYLKDSGFNVWASFENAEYDNDDNPWATIRLHYLSNEVTRNGSYPAEEVPMVPCENKFVDPNVKDLWYPGIIYCPDWQDRHRLYGTYRHNIHSWLRLAVHRCDPERRAAVGKECADEEEINQFFFANIYTVQLQRAAPSMDAADYMDFVREYFVDINFQHPINNVTVTGKEYNIVRNKVVLEDGLLGIVDNDITHEIIDAEVAEVEYYKTNQVGAAKGMVYYSNFQLTEKNTMYYRIAYTSMDVIGEVGGLVEGVKMLIIVLLIPVNYNLNSI